MRMGLSLTPLLEDGYFTRVWDPDRHIQAPRPGLHLRLIGSIDHSFRSGRVAVGVTGYHVSGLPGSRRLVGYDLVDVLADGADYDRVAVQFMDALDAAGIPLEAIDQWVGDRASVSTLTYRRRDNFTWRGAILALLRARAAARGISPSTVFAPTTLWRISTPKKHPGSSEYIMGEMRRALAEDPSRLYLAPGSEHVIHSVATWDGRPAAPEKDPLDRLGYSWEAAHRHEGIWRDGVG